MIMFDGTTEINLGVLRLPGFYKQRDNRFCEFQLPPWLPLQRRSCPFAGTTLNSREIACIAYMNPDFSQM